ncbi:hypothetical protein A2Z67_02400 [Candidatus Woesebacteria bacterium RBG_13_36_22]|uniref:Uncharacterized protein n=1 Tax=Candidatus Woesebacteria bacterium RBG_13_36_22 TaxID=1802478 RepID=A0A1F7X3F2_9BACT|nr:MAG: hypothetical protein A2Z67_02400 [Candidatus Woesebacteria bacterium RBG_13_36_22]
MKKIRFLFLVFSKPIIKSWIQWGELNYSVKVFGKIIIVRQRIILDKVMYIIYASFGDNQDVDPIYLY